MAASFEDLPCWQCKNLDDMGGCKLNDYINPIWLTEEETNRFKCFMYDKVATSYRRVREYIEKRGYKYTVEEVVVDSYNATNLPGFYTSHAMTDVIEHCKLEVGILSRVWV